MHVLILGTRGIPASHGGFETFAQDLALYLVSRGHQVTVYCQNANAIKESSSEWMGVRLVSFHTQNNPIGACIFDLRSSLHAMGEKGVILTLGYNTAVLTSLFNLRGLPTVMNMDGLEWKRDKWSAAAKMWLWANEWIGAKLSHHLIADHPAIGVHLSRHTSPSKISVIPYGAAAVTDASADILTSYGLEPYSYDIVVARPEPENSLLEIVRSHVAASAGLPLAVLGTYDAANNSYHRLVKESADSSIRFLDSIYEPDRIRTLRYYCRAYIHGHRVGGTNPSLVEALAAGNAVVAHDNKFNRWVAGPEALYFANEQQLKEKLLQLPMSNDRLEQMRAASRRRHAEEFTQEKILSAYEQLLQRFADEPVKGISREYVAAKDI